MGEPATAEQTAEIVQVRMYRGILGDFFVLTHRMGGRVYRALIDCGALQCIGATGSKPATQASLDRLGLAIDDLLGEATHYDLVIATHEHYDHLGGFLKYFAKFRDAPLTIGEVWLAWTENDGDELAVAIRERRSKGLAALGALVGSGDNAAAHPAAFGLDMSDSETASSVACIRNLLQFYGELDDWAPADAMGLAAGAPPVPRSPRVPPRSCSDAFAWLKATAGEQAVRYLDPGQQIAFGLDARLTANVLGPPRTRERLLQLDPSADPDTREVYLTKQDDYAALMATMARKLDRSAARALGMDMPSDVEEFTPVDRDPPFSARFNRWPRQGEDQAEGDPPDPISRLYYDEDWSDRRIDGDWLGAAETLGLKIDGDVNNTSLALAIEVPGGHVLLFPADAQVGNWLSWHDQLYPSKPGVKADGGQSAADLLARVVLYKVGHHGSHNATAKAKGLELMTSPNLVAMIPVVEDVAGEQKTRSNPEGWAMPFDNLFDRLKAKTLGRIVRGDGDIAAERKAFTSGLFALDYAPGDDPLWAALTLRV